jgi:signal transduction histidine kinase/ActR/RegA family two-component response regulator
MNISLLRRSLKVRVTLFVLVMFALSLGGLGYYADRMLHDDMERLIGTQQTSAASLVAGHIEQELQDRLNWLERCAQALGEGRLNNPAALQAFLENRIFAGQLFNGGLIVTDASGTAIGDSPRSAGRLGINYMDRESVALAIRDGKSNIGKPGTGKAQKIPVLVLAVPIRDREDRVIGSILGVLYLGKTNFLSDILEPGFGKTGGYLVVAPQYNLIVTATDRRRVMEDLPPPGVSPILDRRAHGDDSTMIFVNPIGDEVLSSARRIPIAGWYVAAIMPTAEAFAPIRDMQQRILLATVMLTVLACGLTWWLLRWLLAPIQHAAQALSTHTGFQPLPSTSQDEIGNLIGGFNRLLGRLHRREAELEKHRHHLEDLVGERTVELEAARIAAETANIAKSAFLANTSHEIRTPLNAITGMAHILRRSGLTPQQVDKLDKIENAGNHLLGIINDVLDLSKIEAGKFALEDAPVHIEALLSNIVSMLGQKARDKGLGFYIETVSLPHNLRGDPTRLQQALLNYAANALKFTETGHITLRVKEEAQTDETVALRFEVEDTGIGLGPEALSRLFGAFEQADNTTTRKYGGTGLGLAITKKIAEAMGGTAGVTTTAGKGSTFWFTAVLRKAGQGAEEAAKESVEAAEQAIQRNHAGKRILLAEDEPINREIALMLLLEEVGLNVDMAEDGREAVEKASSGSYAIILMDMQMPVLDGLDATRQIRQLPGHQATPILAMTANAFAENKDQCFNAGMDDFLTKPVKPEILYATLLRWFEMRQG